MAKTADQLVQFQHNLGHSFKDRALLQRALVHASARAASRIEDNERLEFLGDRVLGLAIADLLCARFPDAREGQLAREFNGLVQRDTCAQVAESMKLADHIRLTGSELTNGGRGKASILADACEAVLGAIFLDAGFDAASRVIQKFWEPLLSGGPGAPRDPKTALQEWAQGRGKGLPVYLEVERHGPDHAPIFTSEVRIEGLKAVQGQGPSKRLAEQDAARAMLERHPIREKASDRSQS